MDSLAGLSIFDELADGVVAFGDDGRYIYANPAALKLFGDPGLVGHHVGDYTRERSPNRIAAGWTTLRREGRLIGEGEIARPDGRRVQVRYRGAANFMPGVHLSLFAALEPGPRARRSFQDGARTDVFRAAFETGVDPMLLCDDSRRYLDGNRAARSFLGVSREDLLRRRIDDFTPPAARADLDRVWELFLKRGSLEGVFPIQLANGLQRTILFRARANVTPGRHVSTFRVASPDHQQTELALEAGRAARLTRREREVLTLLARGSSAEAIAKREVLSPETVRTHARNAMRKLGAHSRPHAIALAIKSRQIDP